MKLMRSIWRIVILLIVLLISNNVECSKKYSKKLSKGDTNGGFGLNYTPKKYDNVLIFLHGLCSSAMELEVTVLSIINKNFLPNTKWILPTSKYRKVTAFLGNKCPAWFDISSFSLDKYIDDEKGLLESVRRIHRIIKKEISFGIDSSRIFLLGFSQGAAVALITGLIMRDIILGGVISIGGWITLRDELKLGINSKLNNRLFNFDINEKKRKNTKIMLFRGSEDNLITMDIFLQTAAFLKDELGLNNIKKRLYFELDHFFAAIQILHILYELSEILIPNNINDDLISMEECSSKNRGYGLLIKTMNRNNEFYIPIPCGANGTNFCLEKKCDCSRITFYEKEYVETLIDLYCNSYKCMLIEGQYLHNRDDIRKGDFNIQVHTKNESLYIDDKNNNNTDKENVISENNDDFLLMNKICQDEVNKTSFSNNTNEFLIDSVIYNDIVNNDSYLIIGNTETGATETPITTPITTIRLTKLLVPITRTTSRTEITPTEKETILTKETILPEVMKTSMEEITTSPEEITTVSTEEITTTSTEEITTSTEEITTSTGEITTTSTGEITTTSTREITTTSTGEITTTSTREITTTSTREITTTSTKEITTTSTREITTTSTREITLEEIKRPSTKERTETMMFNATNTTVSTNNDLYVNNSINVNNSDISTERVPKIFRHKVKNCYVNH